MDHETTWNSTEVLAWTEHGGPRRAPTGPNRIIGFVLAGVLATVFTGIVFSDSLCPEHRAWVQTLGAIALFGTATAIVGLIRGWAAAPAITIVSAAIGVAIGVIDMAHDPTRGKAVATAFGIVVVGAFFLCVHQLLLSKWEDEEIGSLARSANRLDVDDADPSLAFPGPDATIPGLR